MATLFESLGFFSDVFEFFIPFLLVFAVSFGILIKTKFLTENPNVNAAIAFAIAMVVALGGGGAFLMNLTPFFAIFFIIIFFVMLIFMFFGVNPEDIMQSKAVIVLIVLICAIFVFFVIGEMFGDELAIATIENGNGVINDTVPGTPVPGVGPRGVAYILSHPTVLGALVLLGLLALATFFIVNKPK